MFAPKYTQLAHQIDEKREVIRKILASYQRPSISRSVWQLVNTLVPFFVSWGLTAYVFNRFSYWLALPLALLTAGFMVRAFIIFHDCTHGSFFQSKTANDVVGRLLGALVFTPYDYWKHEHNIHHATAGNLDKRGTGDVPTWTVEEYRSRPWYARLGYRLLRQPVFLLTVVSFYIFAISHRFWLPGTGRREKASVMYTNLALLAILGLLVWGLGWQTVLAVQGTVLLLASSGGLWLFYVQHNFEDTYWERQSGWDFYKAGLLGSSFYQLPAILNWFTGNIGYHHIHHLSPRIPNYNLPKVHRADPIFQQVQPLTLWRSFKSLSYRLWDEKQNKLVGFGDVQR